MLDRFACVHILDWHKEVKGPSTSATNQTTDAASNSREDEALELANGHTHLRSVSGLVILALLSTSVTLLLSVVSRSSAYLDTRLERRV